MIEKAQYLDVVDPSIVWAQKENEAREDRFTTLGEFPVKHSQGGSGN